MERNSFKGSLRKTHLGRTNFVIKQVDGDVEDLPVVLRQSTEVPTFVAADGRVWQE